MAITLPNMQAQDELATLFDRNMVLDQAKVQHQQPAVQQAQVPQITYSITQHYNHSAHVARQQQQQQAQQAERRFSEPAQSEYPVAEKILSNHGVDPSSLSQAQIQLFKEADDDQKRRLVQLWSIFPPIDSGGNNNNSNPALAWSTTSLEQEEHMGRLRYERYERQRERERELAAAAAVAHGNDGPTMMSLDGTTVPVPFQGGDGRWMMVDDDSSNYMMEPYMSSGYETSSITAAAVDGPREYRPATDPAYKSAHSPIDWASRQRAMENQYGAFTQCRREA